MIDAERHLLTCSHCIESNPRIESVSDLGQACITLLGDLGQGDLPGIWLNPTSRILRDEDLEFLAGLGAEIVVLVDTGWR